MNSGDDWTVVVAARSPATAKSRLSVLGDTARRQLAEAFVADVLDCLAAVAAIRQVMLLTDVNGWSRCPRGGESAGLLHDQRRGLNTELACAAALLPRPVAFMHADLPCLRPAEVEQVLREGDDVRAGVVPDHASTGSTATTFRSEDVFARFGAGSHQRHRASGAVTIGTSLPGLRLDVDAPDDLARAHSLGLGRHTQRALEEAPLPRWFRKKLAATSP
ncbi:2-phospho-L-lactate guanylyltransferase [Saccharopolyspora shandongensis]|uniref:2-phospho-L-lactate guanylyltransferase n=1 Tax=Saccharopolyspora shandongensis TaxID=418495 RepID=UPI0033E92943